MGINVKKISIFLCCTISLVIIFSCNAPKQKEAISQKATPIIPVYKLYNDSTVLKSIVNKTDTINKEDDTDNVKKVKENFNRINAVKRWTATDKKDLWETTEGGEATFYYSNTLLEKIVTRNYGETFQQVTEYYLLNKKLSFVFEKTYRYNRPLFYDSAAMKASNDDEVFNFTKSIVTEKRNYFLNEKLFKQITNQKTDEPITKKYLQEEQKSMKQAFNKLLKLEKEK